MAAHPLPLVFHRLAGFPSVPTGDLQQHFFALHHLGARCVNAEDEMAAISIALGAAYAGALAVTATNGPGLALNAEGLGLVRPRVHEPDGWSDEDLVFLRL